MSEMLLDQKIANVDYQDEQKFAEAAAKLAQTGLDAFDLTLRKSCGNGGEGLFDANTNQAFGCGEWVTRTEMGAVYNWMTGNALLPTNAAPNQKFADRGIAKIDRTTALSLGTLCTVVDALDRKLADYGAGMNPLGLSPNAIPFDIDPDELAAKKSHIEQILARTEKALANCRTVLDYANVYGSRLRQLQGDETAALAEREKTEQAYNNQLVAIYGTPFPGDIGPGGTYPQGYEGPDLYNYNCMDLSVYGLDGLDAGLSKTTANYTRRGAGFDTKMEGTVDITYTVSPGGIRLKNPNMTGVRATEGTLQSKYRDYLVAYKAYKGACAAYDSAVSTMDRVAYDARVDISTSTFGAAFKLASLLVGFLADDASGETTKERWKMVDMHLLDVRKLLTMQAGFQIAGTATGADAAKQAKLMQAAAKLDVGDVAKNDYLSQSDASVTNAWNAYKDVLTGQDASMTNIAERLKSLLSTNSPNFWNRSAVQRIISAAQLVYDNGLALALKGRDLGRDVESAIDGVKSAAGGIQTAVANLSTAEAAYRAELYRGDLLLEERARWRQQMSNAATASRYADMFNRVQRNIALTKYSTAFDTAQRYVWELAKVYDFETGLLSSDERSGSKFLADIILTRSLGVEGVPVASGTTDGGLYDIVARMKANWDVLEGRLGVNNPDKPTKWFSLRHDLCRIPLASSDENWRKRLDACVVDDIGSLPDFVRYCQPLALSGAGQEQGPGIVMTFGTEIYGDRNFFGNSLVAGDTQFSAADYATKIDAAGVYFQNYDEYADAGGSFVREPNVYLVPIGRDCMRSPAGTDDRAVLSWNVVDQVLPLPYAIGSTELDSPTWISSFSGLNGETANIRRHSTLRMGYNLTSNRLVGRSVWNTKWMLVIPARSLGANDKEILRTFAEKVRDIKIGIRAYSRQGN